MPCPRKALLLILLTASLHPAIAGDEVGQRNCHWKELGKETRSASETPPASSSFAEEIVADRAAADLVRSRLKKRIPDFIKKDEGLFSELAARMRAQALDGYELVAAYSAPGGALKTAWLKNPELVPHAEIPQAPQWIESERATLASRWQKPTPILETEHSFANAEWPIGRPLTLETLPTLQPGTYSYVGVHGEPFIRIGNKNQKHKEFAGEDPADVAGDVVLTRQPDGTMTVSEINLKSSTYMPKFPYLKVAPERLWAQGIYPRDLVVRPLDQAEVEDFFHLVAP